MEPAIRRRIRRGIVWLIVLALLGIAVMTAIVFARRHPENLPWTALDLTRPVGMFTGRKLAALRDHPALCPQLMREAGIHFEALPPRSGGPACTSDDAVRFAAGGARSIDIAPDVGMSCPVAAGLALWEWHVVQPAAARHFGSRVAAAEHLGTYSCRRVNGREDAEWSEHATANAIDVAAFRLEDGRRVSIVEDWTGTPEERAFLREVRDGACGLFATVLSPDYNAAHRNHLHLEDDRARFCR